MGVRSTMHREHHHGGTNWLRAAVLGADDGIVSTASLMIGMAASAAARSTTLVAGLAVLVSGALSMAAGEYVSVSSQRDVEDADIEKEKHELSQSADLELDELTRIYVQRGVEPDVARTVAQQLTAHDPLGSHLRDELGITEESRARPVQAALVSAVSFAVGAVVPVTAFALSPIGREVFLIPVAALVSLAALGALGARLGGARPVAAAVRVTVGGGLAMAVTAVVGRLLGVAVG